MKPLFTGLAAGAAYGLGFLLVEDLTAAVLVEARFSGRQLWASALLYMALFGGAGLVLNFARHAGRRSRRIPPDPAALPLALTAFAVFYLGMKDLPLPLMTMSRKALLAAAAGWGLVVLAGYHILRRGLRAGAGRDRRVRAARMHAAAAVGTLFLILILRVDYDARLRGHLLAEGWRWRAAAALLCAGLYPALRAAFHAGRNRRTWRRALAPAAGLLLAVAASAWGWQMLTRESPPAAVAADKLRTPGGPPDVILIVVDAMRGDHAGFGGYARNTTPHLDAYSRRGVVFRQAWAVSSWTKQSVPALLTGRYTGKAGVRDPFDLLPEANLLLPEALRDGGYHTVCFSSNLFVAPQFQYTQGCAEFHPVMKRGSRQLFFPDDAISSLFHGNQERAYRWNLTDSDCAYAKADAVEREAREWLECNPETRGFLYLHFMDPHTPYLPDPARFSAGKVLTGRDMAMMRSMHHPGDSMRVVPRIHDLLVSRYDDEIANVDQALGRLFRHFDRQGLWNHALVIVTADHGEEFAEHGFGGHGHALFRESIHVPLLVFFPGGKYAGRVVDQQVSLLDIFPTVCVEAGVTPPEGLDGAALQPLLEGRDSLYLATRRPWFAELYHTLEEWPYRHSYAVAQDGWKLMWNVARQEDREDWWGLYDLAADPQEGRNLAPDQPERLARLRAVLDSCRAQGDDQGFPRQEYHDDQRFKDLYEQFRAIGYLR
ncbi:MAG: hypothetical protein C4524_02305 [Candidatus Zixiibacteriota bacterium]|nr:MAG: hypothetical protein C4524_02305 [candidate division Zixibacteria bacterium]